MLKLPHLSYWLVNSTGLRYAVAANLSPAVGQVVQRAGMVLQGETRKAASPVPGSPSVLEHPLAKNNVVFTTWMELGNITLRKRSPAAHLL